MNTFFQDNGNTSLREGRMLRMSPGNNPELQPHPEQPQGERQIDIRGDQMPELLSALGIRHDDARQATEQVATNSIDQAAITAQAHIDAIYSSPNMSPQFVKEYLDVANSTFHQQGLHMSVMNRQVRISPFNPVVRPPEEDARLARVKKLKEQIHAVDVQIKELKKTFYQNAREYRGQKGSAMNPRNFSPEVNRLLAELPVTSMKAHMGPLHQLYAAKFQLEAELAQAKVPGFKVPTQGTDGEPGDESLINDPRFAGSSDPNSRFNLSGQPGGLDENGQPIDTMTPEKEASIARLAARWRTCKTQEERDTVEGFLMMDGVNVDSSDLKNDHVDIAPYEERGVLFLMGFIKVLMSFIERLGKKKTTVDAVDVAEKDPSKMTEEERGTEKETNTTKLEELEGKKTKANTELKTMEKKLKDSIPPLEGEAKEKIENEIKAKKEEIKALEAEITKLEERQKLLAEAGKNSSEEKDGKTKVLKGKELEEDPLFKDFQEFKMKKKGMMHAALSQVLASGNVEKNMEKLCKAIGLNMTDVKTLTNTLQEFGPKLIKVFDTLIDSATLEKNTAGKYRIRMDMGKAFETAKDTGLAEASETISTGDVVSIAKEMNAEVPVHAEGLTVVTDFLDIAQLKFTGFSGGGGKSKKW